MTCPSPSRRALQAARIGAYVAALLVVSSTTASPAAVANAACADAVSSTALSCTFAYTGGEQTYVVPTGVNGVQVLAVGARGGGTYTYFGYDGGSGASVTATIPVSGGTTLYIEVGGPGAYGTRGAAGGFNGGGAGSTVQASGGGGGASDVQTCSITASSCLATGDLGDPRLVVAGGGGALGAAYNPYGGPGPFELGGAAGDTRVTGAGAGGAGVGSGPADSGGYGGYGGVAGGAGGASPSGHPGGSGTAGVGGSVAGDTGPDFSYNVGGGGGGGFWGGGAGGGGANAIPGVGGLPSSGGSGGAGSSSWEPNARSTSMVFANWTSIQTPEVVITVPAPTAAISSRRTAQRICSTGWCRRASRAARVVSWRSGRARTPTAHRDQPTQEQGRPAPGRSTPPTRARSATP